VSNQTGILYIVATPIGNLQDLSPRAQSILRTVKLIAAEDTRHSHQLLEHFGISTPLQALHDHNERQITQTLLQRLLAGDSIALISDAGTPLISDPGYHLVAAAHAQHLPVIPIPGPCALIAALSVAGIPTDHFIFEGFLPAKTVARKNRLESLAQETRTMIFYETPHRLLDCLTDMTPIFGQGRIIVLAKELTKLFETVHKDTLAGLIDWLTAQPERQKGEFVLVVQGAPPPDEKTVSPETQRIFQILRQELPLNQAAKLTSQITGASKNVLYALGLEK
jgi:16S rRNA (cytidine1402-2'-O)-methyltransferase